MVRSTQAEISPNTSNEISFDAYPTKIRVLGAGGAGNNTIHRLNKLSSNQRYFQTIAVNTDAQDLREISADRRILIGKNLTAGLGAGGDPEIGERSAEESIKLIDEAIEGTDLLFLTCGFGGGTGTGSLSVIGKLARKRNILTVAIVTMPFSEEGLIRWENAQVGLEKLKNNVDSIIVLRNDKLLDWVSDLPMSEAFRAGDEILINALIGLSGLIQNRGLINLDFADVATIMHDGPDAMIGLGESRSENRAEEAVKRAITHPMMDTDISGAQSILIHVTGGPDMTLKEAKSAIHTVTRHVDPAARIVWGISVDNSLDQVIRCLLVVTGLSHADEPQRVDEFENSIEIDDFDTLQHSSTMDLRPQSDEDIFNIKDRIMDSGEKTTTTVAKKQPVTQTTMVFYNIFEDEADGDLKRFDRAMHLLRETPSNRRALIDAKQSCKLLLASARMFGFDEIGQLLGIVEEILNAVQAKEIQLTAKIIDSITLAMEMVIDLIENRSDGRGETGYIVDRLKELKREQKNKDNF